MATTVFGYNPTRNNYFFTGGALFNQAWDNSNTVTATGRIIALDAYFGGDTAGCTGGPVLWNASGSVLVDGSNHSVAQGSRNANGGFVVNHTGLDIGFGSPTVYTVGGFRNSADSWVVPFADNVGAFGALRTVSGTTPGTALSGTTWLAATGFNGGIQAHATYFIVELYVLRSGVWTKSLANVRRSGSWGSVVQVYLRRSGVWIQIARLAERGELDWKREFEVMVVYGDGTWEKGLMRWDYDQPRRFGFGISDSVVQPGRELLAA